MMADSPHLYARRGGWLQTLTMLVGLFVLLHTACSAEPPPAVESKPSGQAAEATQAFAPGLTWLNVSRPLTFGDLRGKVVILDFWTYGCINCIHVLADLKRLEKKYGDRLLVIGVHTPKFDNEKNLATLRHILLRYGIEHPVVNDVDSLLAARYGMRAWPTRVLIDPDGQVLGRVTGEGRYKLFDQTIQALLDKYPELVDPGPAPLKLEKEQLAGSLLAAPGKLAVSPRYVAISDSLHNRILLCDHQGWIERVFGGLEAGRKDGAAAQARFNNPQGLAFDAAGGLYVADTGNHLIRYIDLERARVETLAGNGRLERKHNGWFDARAVGLASPWGLAWRDGELYIAMAGSHQIWRYDAKTGKTGPFAGTGREGIDDGDRLQASFSQPSGLSIFGDWLYVADAEDSALRRIHLQQGRVETLVGSGLFDFGDRDGPLNKARLQHLLGVVAGSETRIYIADTYNHKLKLVDLDLGTVRTLLGDGIPGRGAGPNTPMRLNEPGGLARLDDRLLIADTNNDRIVAYGISGGEGSPWPVRKRQDPLRRRPSSPIGGPSSRTGP